MRSVLMAGALALLIPVAGFSQVQNIHIFPQFPFGGGWSSTVMILPLIRRVSTASAAFRQDVLQMIKQIMPINFFISGPLYFSHIFHLAKTAYFLD